MLEVRLPAPKGSGAFLLPVVHLIMWKIKLDDDLWLG